MVFFFTVIAPIILYMNNVNNLWNPYKIITVYMVSNVNHDVWDPVPHLQVHCPPLLAAFVSVSSYGTFLHFTVVGVTINCTPWFSIWVCFRYRWLEVFPVLSYVDPYETICVSVAIGSTQLRHWNIALFVGASSLWNVFSLTSKHYYYYITDYLAYKWIKNVK